VGGMVAGKPVTEKGVAGLLHEYRIFSRDVGPEDHRVKGYRRVDFADVWKRYCEPKNPVEEQDPGILPRSRAESCNHYAFAEKTPAQQNEPAREKNDGFSNNINVLSGCAGNNAETGPLTGTEAALVPDDGLNFPDDLRRCDCCKNGNPPPNKVVLPDRTVWLHHECEAAWIDCTEDAENSAPR
jgi:Protein of unknown function (DUF3631)